MREGRMYTREDERPATRPNAGQGCTGEQTSSSHPVIVRDYYKRVDSNHNSGKTGLGHDSKAKAVSVAEGRCGVWQAMQPSCPSLVLTQYDSLGHQRR